MTMIDATVRSVARLKGIDGILPPYPLEQLGERDA